MTRFSISIHDNSVVVDDVLPEEFQFETDADARLGVDRMERMHREAVSVRLHHEEFVRELKCLMIALEEKSCINAELSPGIYHANAMLRGLLSHA